MEIIKTIFSEIWTSAVFIAAFGLVISLSLEAFKKWLKLRSEKLITLLLSLFSLLAAILEYAIDAVPVGVGGIMGVVFMAASLIYRYIVKPTKLSIQEEINRRAALLSRTTAPLQNVTVPVAPVQQDTTDVDNLAPVPESEFPV